MRFCAPQCTRLAVSSDGQEFRCVECGRGHSRVDVGTPGSFRVVDDPLDPSICHADTRPLQGEPKPLMFINCRCIL